MNLMDGNCRVILVFTSDEVTNASTHTCHATANYKSNATNNNITYKINDRDNNNNNNSKNKNNNGSLESKVRWHDKETVLMHRGYHVVCMLPLLELLNEHQKSKDKASLLLQTSKDKHNGCEYQNSKNQANSVTKNSYTMNTNGSSNESSKNVTTTENKMQDYVLSIDEVIHRIRSFCTQSNISISKVSAWTILQRVENSINKQNGEANRLTKTIEHECTATQGVANETVTNSDNHLEDAMQESKQQKQLEIVEHTKAENARTFSKGFANTTNKKHEDETVTRISDSNVNDKETLFSSLFTIVSCHPSQLNMLVYSILDANCFLHLSEIKSENSYGVSARMKNNNVDSKIDNSNTEEHSANNECNETQQHTYPLLVVFDMTRQEEKCNTHLFVKNINSACEEEDEEESEEDCWAWLRPTPSYVSEFCQVMNTTSASFYQANAINKKYKSSTLDNKSNEKSNKMESKINNDNYEHSDDIEQLLLFKHLLHTHQDRELQQMEEEQIHHTSLLPSSSSSLSSQSSSLQERDQEEQCNADISTWSWESNRCSDTAIHDLSYVKWCAIPVVMYSSYPIIRDTGCVFANTNNNNNVSKECSLHHCCNDSSECVLMDRNQCTLEAILRECAYKVGAMAKYGS